MIPRDEAEALAVVAVWTLLLGVVVYSIFRTVDRLTGRYQH